MRVNIEFTVNEVTQNTLQALAMLMTAQNQWTEPTTPPVDEDTRSRGKEVCRELVSYWSEGWEPDYGPTDPDKDRGALLNDLINGEKGQDLMAYLRHEGQSQRNMIEVGATQEVARNIISVGTALGLWNTK